MPCLTKSKLDCRKEMFRKYTLDMINDFFVYKDKFIRPEPHFRCKVPS